MDDLEFRRRVQEMIVAIIRSGASREHMTALLRSVHKEELWPAMMLELALLSDREGEGV